MKFLIFFQNPGIFQEPSCNNNLNAFSAAKFQIFLQSWWKSLNYFWGNVYPGEVLEFFFSDFVWEPLSPNDENIFLQRTGVPTIHV